MDEKKAEVRPTPDGRLMVVIWAPVEAYDITDQVQMAAALARRGLLNVPVNGAAPPAAAPEVVTLYPEMPDENEMTLADLLPDPLSGVGA